MNTIALTSGQTVQVDGFSPLCGRIRVYSLRQFCAHRGLDYASQKAASVASGHQLAWSLKDGECLASGDPQHLRELYEAERAEIAAAPTIMHGDIISIDGDNYAVVVNGERYSDPVLFRATQF